MRKCFLQIVLTLKTIDDIIGTLSEVFHELSVSNTCPLSECKPKAQHEVNGHGVIGTLSGILWDFAKNERIKKIRAGEKTV